MNLEIDINKLRENKLFVVTPMYGGQCSGLYTKSLLDLFSMCSQYGIHMRYYSLHNESLITRARNYAADEFMRSDCTHLMFIDADIEFNPEDVLALLALSEPGKDILGGPYCKKSVSWEKIKRAVDKGFADQNPAALENFVGDFAFNLVSNQDEFSISEPIEVLELGTGFMLVRKEVFEAWNSNFPEYSYLPDHIRTKGFDGSREIMAYFQDPIDSKKRHLSEDYFFCQKSREIGLKVWLCPWMRLNHIGTYVFKGNLAAIAAIGAPATADPNEIKSMKG